VKEYIEYNTQLTEKYNKHTLTEANNSINKPKSKPQKDVNNVELFS